MANIELYSQTALLGAIRDLSPKSELLYPTICPLKEVGSLQVIVDRVRPVTGIAQKRSPDAEASLAPKDAYKTDMLTLADWAIKERFSMNDVAYYREVANLPVESNPVANSLATTFRAKKDAAPTKLRNYLDNRLEWLAINTYRNNLSEYGITTVGIPADQYNVHPSNDWNDLTNGNPLGDIDTWKELVRDRTGATLATCIMSSRVFQYLKQNTRFAQTFSGQNPMYDWRIWNNDAVKSFFKDQTEMDLIIYDGMYETKNLTTQVVTSTRFLPRNEVIFLPKAVSNEFSYLAAMLTAPHMQGNWQPGFYAWQEEKNDPPIYIVGAGIQAFPHLASPEAVFHAVVLSDGLS